MKQLNVFLFIIFTVTIVVHTTDLDEWKAYKLKYGKNYQNESEEKLRMDTFLKNKHKIDKHNERHAKGLTTYTMGLNRYSDSDARTKLLRSSSLVASTRVWNKTNEYFVGSRQQKTLRNYRIRTGQHLPGSIDWRHEGAVNDEEIVQGDCDSSWAFAVSGSVEGQYFRKRGKLIQLSVQNLIDCASDFKGDCGCAGCSLSGAYRYIQFSGINKADDYPTPYLAKDGVCRFNSTNSIKIMFYDLLTRGDEYKLREAIATIGPIAIEIDGSHDSLRHYSGGIYYEPECSSHRSNHAVLAVGYGTDENGEDYYILKNWLGKDWGEKGYFRLARNRCNHCGVATDATYPLLFEHDD